MGCQGGGTPIRIIHYREGQYRFSGKDFVLVDEGTLRCPAGKLLRPRSRVPLRNGNLRICYSAKIADCRSCALASQCIGVGAYGDKPRQVSAIRQRLEPTRRPKVTPWQEPEPPPGSVPEMPCELVWCNVGGRKLRRTWFTGLRRQQVHLQEHVLDTQSSSPPAPAGPALLSRAERAHARLSWTDRLVRNARTSSSAHFHITLFGVAEHLATYLNLASVSAGGSSFRSSCEARAAPARRRRSGHGRTPLGGERCCRTRRVLSYEAAAERAGDCCP